MPLPSPRSFKVSLSIDINKCLRVDFQDGDECSAMVSEPLTGEWEKDAWKFRNFRDVLPQVMMERFYPELALPYKAVVGEEGVMSAVIDTETLEQRKAKHADNFQP